MKKKGFTLIELLVVIAIIALLVSILMPSLGRVREMARRALCQSNLSAIGKGLAMYKAEYNDSYPWLQDQPIGEGTTFAYEWYDCNVNSNALGSGDPNTNAPVGGLDMDEPNHWISTQGGFGEDMVNNLNLLAYRGHVAYAMFLCPSTGTKPADRTNEDANAGPVNNDFGLYLYTAGKNKATAKWYLDYGYHIGYLTIPKNINTAFSQFIPNTAGLTDNLDGGFVIMADAPMAASAVDRANGPDNNWNHGNEVVNTLSASSSVGKVTFDQELNKGTGAFAVNGDDIYSAMKDPNDPNGFTNPAEPNGCTPKTSDDQSIYHPRYFVP